MTPVKKLPFITLMLLITLGSVNAIFFTPSLPEIAMAFRIPDHVAQSAIAWYLAGYALGQLLYSPFTNRYGRKPALLMGLILGLVASALCISSAFSLVFAQFLLGRSLLALGTGVGFKMAFILVHDVYDAQTGNKLISYLISAFAVVPGLGLVLAGYLSGHYGWLSCQWFSFAYIIISMILVLLMPETISRKDKHALAFKKLLANYIKEIRRVNLWQGAILMGLITAISYLFAAIGPFIGMQLLGLNETQYGSFCFLPQVGMFIGCLLAAYLTKKKLNAYLLPIGIIVSLGFTLLMLIGFIFSFNPIIILFANLMLVYLGTALIFNAGPAIAFKNAYDSAYTSGLLNFINLSLAMGLVSGVSHLPLGLYTLPLALLVFLCASGLIFLSIKKD